MSEKKDISKRETETSVDAFLDQVNQLPQTRSEGTGRLIFAMDATASRAPTWDIACDLQGQMFSNTKGLGGLQIQLVYFRGFRECRASKWVSDSSQLHRLMSSVSCLAGRTQIARVLKHALSEVRGGSEVNALVYVGDCMEEPLDELGDLAGRLKLSGVPVFVFQEGNDPVAYQAFSQVAALSGGAHSSLDRSSAHQLGLLLNAVAVYAAGGREAFNEHCRLTGGMVKRLGKQLE